jgi:hypothetical protein
MIPLSIGHLVNFAGTCQSNDFSRPFTVTITRPAVFELIFCCETSFFYCNLISPSTTFLKHRILFTPAPPTTLLTSFFVLPSLNPNQFNVSSSWLISRGLSFPTYRQSNHFHTISQTGDGRVIPSPFPPHSSTAQTSQCPVSG